MKKVFTKIKNWFKKIKPTKRKIVQLYVALLYNANLKGFIKGEIYTGKTKVTCVPGLNCYSCPGAVGSCPLGSIQSAVASSNKGTLFYVFGIIMLYGLIFGRTICGWLCPVGLCQELLYKIKTPKLRKNKFTKVFSYFKYVLLVVLVIIVPLAYSKHNLPVPGFCKFICPAGLFEGAFFLLAHKNNVGFFALLNSIFTWKFFLFVIFVVASIFIFRFFCRFFCPLGAIYGFFNKFSFLGVKVDKDKCSECGLCVSHCKMDINKVGDHECINCGECIKTCPSKAIDWKLIRKKIKEEDNVIEETQDNKETKKDKSKINKLILQIVAVVILVASLVYFNFFDKQSSGNNNIVNTFENFQVNMYDNSQSYDINNEKIKIIYFYNNVNEVELDSLNDLALLNQENLDVLLIHNYNNYEEMETYTDLNLILAYDDDNSTALKAINENLEYPSTIILDKQNNFIYNSNILEFANLKYYVNPFLEGKVLGNEIGNVCKDYVIPLYYSDDDFSINNSRGKVTIINFWSTTCSSCIAEMKYFEQFYNQYSSDVNVIAIHTTDITTSVEDFMYDSEWDLFNISFGQDQKGNALKDYFTNSSMLPLTIVLDNYGVIKEITYSSMNVEKLVNFYNMYNVVE